MEIQLWREILNPYELAVRELTDKFNHLIKEHKVKNLYSPIEEVSGRVKSVTSILESFRKTDSDRTDGRTDRGYRRYQDYLSVC